MLLCLCYAEEIIDFLLKTVYPAAARNQKLSSLEFESERQLNSKLRHALSDATAKGTMTYLESEQIAQRIENRGSQSKKSRIAISDLVDRGCLSINEGEELKLLIDYRNDIAHRLYYLIMDLSPEQHDNDFLNIIEKRYKYNALDRLKFFRRELPKRCARRYVVKPSMHQLSFGALERAYDEDLKALDRIIRRQYSVRRRKMKQLNTELKLEDTGLVGDLHPRVPANFTPAGKLTPRGIEICYRLFDVGKSPLGVAYIMGMTYKSMLNRFKSWHKAGGRNRQRAEVKRYDPTRTLREPQNTSKQDAYRSSSA